MFAKLGVVQTQVSWKTPTAQRSVLAPAATVIKHTRNPATNQVLPRRKWEPTSATAPVLRVSQGACSHGAETSTPDIRKSQPRQRQWVQYSRLPAAQHMCWHLLMTAGSLHEAPMRLASYLTCLESKPLQRDTLTASCCSVTELFSALGTTQMVSATCP
jgi:hypothetical protein